jgi:hypothetical protein
MPVRTSIFTTSLIATALFVSAAAHADTLWVFAPTPGHTNSDPNGVFVTNGGAGGASPANPQAYTANALTITATGYIPNGLGGVALGALFEKNLGGDESGLGLTNDPTMDHEITVGSFIQFDLNNLSASLGQLSFKAGSTTNGEGWALVLTNTVGSLTGATPLDSCTAPSSGSGTCENTKFYSGVLGGPFRYLDVEAVGTGANVLVSELDTHAVPGPIVGAGLPGLVAACGGLLALARRRRQLVA